MHKETSRPNATDPSAPPLLKVTRAVTPPATAQPAGGGDAPSSSHLTLPEPGGHGLSHTRSPHKSQGNVTSYPTDGAGRLRALEQYMDTFPIERPETAPTLVLGPPAREDNRPARGAFGSASPSPNATKDDRRNERELTQRRAQREANRTTTEALRRQKIEAWMQLSEKNNRKLRKENDALSKIAALTQENCINNDARYEAALESLRSELEYTTLFRQDNAATIGFVHESVALIQDRIVQMKVQSEKQAQAEFANIRQAFEEQLRQRTEELDTERELGQSTTGQWVTKNQTLQADLEKALMETDSAYDRYKKLSDHHKALQVEYDAQSGDAVVLERQFKLASAHHQRLKDRLHDLEVELAAAPGRTSPTGLPRDAEVLEAESNLQNQNDSQQKKGADYAATLMKLKRILEVEARHLRGVRKAHLRALKQRTELEVFLRQAVVHHLRWKQQCGALSAPATDSAVSANVSNINYDIFTADDRRQVLENLLSIERVLELMYADPAFNGDSGESVISNGQKMEKRIADAKKALGRDASLDEEEVSELWEKWKRWTTRADRCFDGPRAVANVVEASDHNSPSQGL